MKCSKIVLIALSLALCWALTARAADKCQWKPLFDGKTLDGWHKVGHGEWEVKGGAIVGTADKTKLYGLLESNQVFKDFTVRFKFRCFSGDSGFYVRTMILPPEKAHKMQIQVGRDDGSGTGGVYESYGRGWLDKLSKEDESKIYKPDGEWNEMVIDAHGQDIVVKVNGIKTSAVKDVPEYQAGHFVLQMHAGCVMHVEFKDIEVCDDDPQPKIEPVKAAADGSIVLAATAARGMGPKIKLMPEWKAFGWWMDSDQAEWLVDVPAAGTYDVFLEWSVGDKSAGNPYAFFVGKQELAGTIEKSGGWETYKKAKIGQMTLAPGVQFAAFKPAGKFKNALLDLREVRLVLVAK